MIKTLFKKQDFKNIFLLLLFFSIFVTFTQGVESGLNLESAFLQTRDCSIISDIDGITSYIFIIKATINVICLVPIICKIFASDLDVAKSYLFVRIKSTSIWFAYKTFQCAVYCFFSAVVYNSIILLSLIAMKYKADSPIIVLRNLIYAILVNFIFLFFFCSLGNVLSLKIDQHISVIIVLIFMIVLIIICISTPNKEEQFIFYTYYLVSWFIRDYEYHNHLLIFPSWYYYTVLTAMAVVLPLIGNRILKKSDQL